MKRLFAFLMSVVSVLHGVTQRLDVVAFTSSEKSGCVSSYILTTGRESILVDAPMCLSDSKRLIDTIHRLNRHITTVFISTAQPAQYLGVSEIKKAFPGIKIMAAPEVSLEIANSGDKMYALYKAKLGKEVPAPLELPDTLAGDKVILGNYSLQTQTFTYGQNRVTTTLYEPKQKMLFAGDIVYGKVHLKLDEQSMQEWIQRLRNLTKDNIIDIFPGYGSPGYASLIEECIYYIQTYTRALITKDSLAIFDIMNYYFPGYQMMEYLKGSVSGSLKY